MNPFGTISQPAHLRGFSSVQGGGIAQLLNIAFQTLIVVAGIYAVFNFLFAGYSFLSAGNDPKKITDAWAKIWQSILGLVVTAGAFVLAAIVGKLVFGDYNALLNPTIPTP